jgi:hypothetical protein
MTALIFELKTMRGAKHLFSADSGGSGIAIA